VDGCYYSADLAADDFVAVVLAVDDYYYSVAPDLAAAGAADEVADCDSLGWDSADLDSD
jgi:dihydropteroate synthase